MTSLESSNLTTGTVRNHTVIDIDDISKGERNDGESRTEPDIEPHGNEQSDWDYEPENQLGLPEYQYWGTGVHFSDFDQESNKKGEFLFNSRDGLN